MWLPDTLFRTLRSAYLTYYAGDVSGGQTVGSDERTADVHPPESVRRQSPSEDDMRSAFDEQWHEFSDPAAVEFGPEISDELVDVGDSAGSQLSRLTALATTRLRMTIDRSDCTDIVSFTQRASGMTSVGLNAVALVRAKYR